MVTITADQFRSILREAPADLTYDRLFSYSGRNMHGRECLAIVPDADGQSVASLAFRLGEAFNAWGATLDTEDDIALFDELSDTFEDIRTDDLGLNTVIYFPRIQLDGPGDE